MARADGPLTREKYVAFRDAFPLQGNMCLKLRKLFSLACDDPAPLESHITLITSTFPARHDLYAALVGRLFAIAASDRSPTREEEKLIARISHLLGLPASDYMQIREHYMGAGKPHQTLGVAKHSHPSTLKKRYRELMQRYHPDRFGGQTLSPELDMLLQLKTAEINAAYSQLTRKAA
ncbi:MAG: hypothetical protein EBR02_09680 [Alphaproteobacteria bacterium]|nr:hypothetical protein [Alphaproteobacteria bacterium]